MAAGLGFKTFTTGEVLTAADTNGYLMQGVLVFASSAARAAAITSPQEGQYSYLKDTNSTEYYDGAAWIAAPIGDITGVTAGTGISGGGTSGTVTITNSMATEIAAKGDLIVGTGAATFDNLTVGANGETLVADSSTSTGLRYQAPYSQQSVLNSAMQVWQRGTSIACTSTTYTADRWQGYRSVAGATVSRQVTGDTTNLPFIQYCARVQRDSANTSTTAIYLAQSFESINSIAYAGKTVTLSFYARSGANFTGAFATRLFTGTGTDQNILVSYTGAANPIAQGTTLTSTWQRFSYTATLASTATELALRFDYEPTGTAGANDYYEITGVQLELGSVATPFHTYAATIQGELAACQRYYFRSTGGSTYSNYAFGIGYNTTTAEYTLALPVQMRVTPTSIDFANLMNFDTPAGSGSATTSVTLSASQQSPNFVHLSASGSSGLTQYRNYTLLNNNNAAGYLGFSAEL